VRETSLMSPGPVREAPARGSGSLVPVPATTRWTGRSHRWWTEPWGPDTTARISAGNGRRNGSEEGLKTRRCPYSVTLVLGTRFANGRRSAATNRRISLIDSQQAADQGLIGQERILETYSVIGDAHDQDNRRNLDAPRRAGFAATIPTIADVGK
jgi:hypothetical protein